METKYSLTSDIDPTDEQLEELMQAVLVDVKESAEIEAKQFQLKLDSIKVVAF